VTLEEYPATPENKPAERELDASPLPDQEPPEGASRLAEENQTVEKEMAPRGDDTRDQQAITSSPETEKVKPAPETAAPLNQEEVKRSEPIAIHEATDKGLLADEPAPIEKERIFDGNLSIDQLTKPTPDTLRRMARNQQRGRIKDRSELLEGDAVYLNLQHDYLISFFQRFSNRIESNWNYPAESVQKNEQGVLLLKITVSREGKLIDVDLLDSSGSNDLDYEAIQAVYRAAPFGPITKHWPHEQMKIYAHFQYTLSNRYIFGR